MTTCAGSYNNAFMHKIFYFATFNDTLLAYNF